MLELHVPVGEEFFDEDSQSFKRDTVVVRLEHSLLAMSKWESKYEKPFLTQEEHSGEETTDYIKMMGVDGQIPDELFNRFTKDQFSEINNYIQKKHTATWFREDKSPRSREVTTSEVIYYSMFANGVPLECETWNLNRLITLLKIFGEKNKPEKKMPRDEINRRNRELNAQRRAALKSRG